MAEYWQLEENTDRWQLEDGSGNWELETPPSGGNVTKDEARIHRWHQGDDFVSGAAPAAALDDGLGWTLPIVVKVAAAALSLWFGAVDEVVAQPAAEVVEEQVWTAPVTVNDRLAPWVFTDDDQIVPQAAPTLQITEDYWLVLPEDKTPPRLTLWSENDERPTPPTGFVAEDDPAKFPSIRHEINGIFWATDEPIVPQATGGGVTKDEARILRWPQEGDFAPTGAPTFVEEVDGWPPLFSSPSIYRSHLWAEQDDLPVAVVVDEDVGPNLGVLRVAPFVPTPWSDEDFVAPTPFTIDDEAGWQVPVPACPQPTVTYWVDSDPVVEQPPATISVEDTWPFAGIVPYWPQPQPFLPPWLTYQDQDDPAGSLIFVPPPPAIADQPSGGWGGWKKRRRFDFTEVPSAEEIRRERERLGILPAEVQKAVNKIIREQSAVPQTYESAVRFAEKLTDNALGVKKAIRAEIPAKRAKVPADAVYIAQALILDALRKRFEANLAEETEIQEILDLWLNME